LELFHYHFWFRIHIMVHLNMVQEFNVQSGIAHMQAFVEHNYVFLTINLHNLGVDGLMLIWISFIGINHINIVHLVGNVYCHRITHWKIDWFHMAFHHLHFIRFNLKNCASLEFHLLHVIKKHFIGSKHGKID
jgi:hypothetical protein